MNREKVEEKMATDTEITVRIKFTISLWSAFKLRLCGCNNKNLTDALQLKIDDGKEADK